MLSSSGYPEDFVYVFIKIIDGIVR